MYVESDNTVTTEALDISPVLAKLRAENIELRRALGRAQNAVIHEQRQPSAIIDAEFTRVRPSLITYHHHHQLYQSKQLCIAHDELLRDLHCHKLDLCLGPFRFQSYASCWDTSLHAEHVSLPRWTQFTHLSVAS